MPDTTLGDGLGDERLYYSWVHRFVTFINLSTDSDYAEGTDQYEWLEKTLASVDREKTPWVIVSGHKNLYCSSTYGSNDRSSTTRGDAGDLTKELEPLFEKCVQRTRGGGAKRSEREGGDIRRSRARARRKCVRLRRKRASERSGRAERGRERASEWSEC
jgi:hypothetical protein